MERWRSDIDARRRSCPRDETRSVILALWRYKDLSVGTTSADNTVERVVQRAIELSETPAPSFAEEVRAEMVRGWWSDAGAGDVRIDAVGNVWGLAAGDPDGDAVVVAAHLDTVFPATDDHSVRRVGDRLHGRSIGDNSVAVAGITELIGHPFPVPDGAALWVLATTCEEGLGNLRGVRHALSEPEVRVVAFIAVEGNMLGRVGVEGVASLRLEIGLAGKGGHAWAESEAPSVIHEGARLIVRALDELPIEHGVSSFNVGSFVSAGSINSRSSAAKLQIDMRATSQDSLDGFEKTLRSIIEDVEAVGLTATISELGRRPGGQIADDHPLTQAATAALAEVGVEPQRSSISTDANAAYALGLPAISLGITTGEMHHTPDEWIDIAPIGSGVKALARTIDLYWRHREGSTTSGT